MKVTVLTPAVAEAAGYVMPASRPYLVLAPDGRYAFPTFADARAFAEGYAETAGLLLSYL